jgi:DNA gyrase/topoisomerase IV subunit A
MLGMQNSTQAMYFNKKQYKIEADMLGGKMKTAAITDLKTQKSTLIVTGAGNIKKVVSYNEEPKKPKVTITYDTKTKKKISGYECTKVIITTSENGTITLFVTDKIAPTASPFERQFPGLKGFPLEFSTNNGGARAVFTATEIGSKTTKSDFKIPSVKEGYERMTMDEFQKFIGKTFQ